MKLIVEEFMEYLSSRQASTNTALSYERDINRFINYFDEKNKKIFDLNSEDMQEYVAYLKLKNKSVSTISRTTASIKAFYKFLLSKGLVERNIVDGVETLKIIKKDPMILTKAEVELLLGQPDLNDLKGQRDKAMLELLYATGIRVSELISLKIEDINVPLKYIKVRKKNAQRKINLGVRVASIMEKYIENVRPLIIKSEEEKSLFINTNGYGMTRQGFWKILKQYKDEANIDKELTPHTMRHSYAVHKLQDGMQLKSLQEILGHNDIASTMLYMNYINKT